MKMPLISVLMPAYNHERYVETAVRSVLDQDWPRIELLASDDGSRDGTWNALRGLKPECERKLERVEFERHENLGTSRTLSALRGGAHGDYVAILASDDAYLPGAFSRLMRPMLADADIGLTVGRNEFMDDVGNRCYWDENREVVHDRAKARYVCFNDFIRESTGVDDRGPEFGSYSRLLRMNHVPNGMLIRKAALDRIPDFTMEAPLEDWWMHLQLSKITRYLAIPEATFRYRWHAGNTIKRTERMREYYLRTLAWEERLAEEHAESEWARAFRREYWDVRRKVGLGDAVRLDRVRTLRDRRYVLTLWGRPFTVCRREKAIRP